MESKGARFVLIQTDLGLDHLSEDCGCNLRLYHRYLLFGLVGMGLDGYGLYWRVVNRWVISFRNGQHFMGLSWVFVWDYISMKL
jgi:hypothetical protein